MQIYDSYSVEPYFWRVSGLVRGCGAHAPSNSTVSCLVAEQVRNALAAFHACPRVIPIDCPAIQSLTAVAIWLHVTEDGLHGQRQTSWRLSGLVWGL